MDGIAEGGSGNRPQLYKLIFDQDLDEVHLLIDFISGRADHSLAHLSIPGPNGSTHAMNSREIIQAVADMRFPPKGNDDAVNANNAAMLLLAKDRLSSLAAPARGLTIAYTAMFIGAEVGPWRAQLWHRLSNRWARLSGRQQTASEAARKRGKTADEGDMRLDLAARAFPILQPHACRFRAWRDRLALFSLGWLLLTALAYWDASLGRASLDRLDQNWKTYTEELRDNPALLPCGEAKTPDDQKAAEDARTALACRRHSYHLWMGEAAVQQVRDVFQCRGMHRYQRVIHVWCWHWLLSGSNTTANSTSTTANPVGADTLPQSIKDNATYWQIATSLLSVFTTYVLPMMFALLGTLIGAFRAILNKIRDSELAPRDFMRMVSGIPTGLVAGIAVGLFLSPSSLPVQGGSGVAGQLTLTASGLGFLAGYASQTFFTYLDTVIGTVFPAAASARASLAQSGGAPLGMAPAGTLDRAGHD
jgi:hypothetical protein